ncbi:N-acetyltransferase [Prosthecobacter sp.]|uniref:N-acetyltransferase n=1 Tax=Prosthecobacter sp. TaxID=1965333 RepID=UPI0037838394
MNFHILRETPPVWLGEALERFERQFDYPLGEGRRFRISHGRDYLPFFAAMGDATLTIAEAGGEVLATLVRVERWMHCGQDSPLRTRVHYLCDLKVSPRARCSGVLAKLLWETRRQVVLSGSQACYCIVMDGTGRRPSDYTGRCEIPAFTSLAQIMVLRITSAPSANATPVPVAAPQNFRPRTAYFLEAGNHALRSLMTPVQITGTAWVEDTRRGKRLWTDDGAEMLSAHLSGFRFSDPSSGAQIIRDALCAARASHLPALFVAVPQSLGAALLAEMPGLEILEAPATIYGHGLEPGHDWWVDTAEI